jgi:hypothetical protein
MPSTNSGSGPLTNNPMIEWDGSYETCVAETGQTVKTNLLVYRSASAAQNAVTPCGTFYGSAIEDASEIGIVVGPASSPIYPQTYDRNTTAFGAMGASQVDPFWVHWLVKGDIFWAVSASISCNIGQTLVTAAGGTVALTAAGTTVDKYNVHLFECRLKTSSKTYQLIKYLQMGSVDTA